MALCIGTGDGARLDIYDHDTGWNGPDDPDYSVLSNSEQHGYIFHDEGKWIYLPDSTQIKTEFASLQELFASIDANASLDMPDDLLGWWEDEIEHHSVI
jgi:hypothetical protein